MHNDEPRHPDVRHEPDRVRTGLLVWIGVAFVVVLVGIQGAVSWYFDALRERARRSDPGISALRARERPKLPEDLRRIPPPLLDIAEAVEYPKLRASEEEVLTSYGWVDRQKGVVRLPVAEAMRQMTDPANPHAKTVKSKPAQKAP